MIVKMKRLLLLAALLGVIVLAAYGCVPGPVPVRVDISTPAPDAVTEIGAIAGGEWVLDSYGKLSEPLSPPEGAAPTLVIDEDGKVGGNAGCNGYFGAVVLDGDKATFGELGRTLMACDADRMNMEDAFLAALGSAQSLRLVESRLVVAYNGGQSELVFSRAQESSYQGPEWTLETIIAGSAASSVLANTAITLTYTLGATELSGSAGCNRYAAQVGAADGDLRVDGVGTTKMACSAEIMTQEMAYLSALQAARSASVDDGRLTLHGEDGQALLVFVQPS